MHNPLIIGGIVLLLIWLLTKKKGTPASTTPAPGGAAGLPVLPDPTSNTLPVLPQTGGSTDTGSGVTETPPTVVNLPPSASTPSNTPLPPAGPPPAGEQDLGWIDFYGDGKLHHMWFNPDTGAYYFAPDDANGGPTVTDAPILAPIVAVPGV